MYLFICQLVIISSNSFNYVKKHCIFFSSKLGKKYFKLLLINTFKVSYSVLWNKNIQYLKRGVGFSVGFLMEQNERIDWGATFAKLKVD